MLKKEIEYKYITFGLITGLALLGALDKGKESK